MLYYFFIDPDARARNSGVYRPQGQPSANKPEVSKLNVQKNEDKKHKESYKERVEIISEQIIISC